MCLNKLHFPFTNVKSKIPELELWAIKTNTTFFFIIIQKKKKNLIKDDFESKAETSDRKAGEQWKASPGLRYLETQPINVLNISPRCFT